jgi:hypothetical protein
MNITHILHAANSVYLCDSKENRLELTYQAWNEFMQKRGALSLPFHLSIKETNLASINGDQGVIITDAANI